jgi:hypothetical protein
MTLFFPICENLIRFSDAFAVTFVFTSVILPFAPILVIDNGRPNLSWSQISKKPDMPLGAKAEALSSSYHLVVSNIEMWMKDDFLSWSSKRLAATPKSPPQQL